MANQPKSNRLSYRYAALIYIGAWLRKKPRAPRHDGWTPATR